MKRPIFFLDVDETLFFSITNNGTTHHYNEHLISALKEAGITEVYLLTSYDLSIYPDPEMRKEEPMITRHELIDHLKQQGISVKLVATNYDILVETKEKKLVAGSYYEDVVRPFEVKIVDDPTINLKEDDSYNETITLQSSRVEPLYHLWNAPESGYRSIKGAVSNLLFKQLINEGEIDPKDPPPILFFDDKPDYLEDVIATGQRNHLSITPMRVTKQLSREDYDRFLMSHLPDSDKVSTFIRRYENLLQEVQNTKSARPNPFSKLSKVADSLNVAISKLKNHSTSPFSVDSLKSIMTNSIAVLTELHGKSILKSDKQTIEKVIDHLHNQLQQLADVGLTRSNNSPASSEAVQLIHPILSSLNTAIQSLHLPKQTAGMFSKVVDPESLTDLKKEIQAITSDLSSKKAVTPKELSDIIKQCESKMKIYLEHADPQKGGEVFLMEKVGEAFSGLHEAIAILSDLPESGMKPEQASLSMGPK